MQVLGKVSTEPPVHVFFGNRFPVNAIPDNNCRTCAKFLRCMPPRGRFRGGGGRHLNGGMGAVCPHHHFSGFPMKIRQSARNIEIRNDCGNAHSHTSGVNARSCVFLQSKKKEITGNSFSISRVHPSWSVSGT